MLRFLMTSVIASLATFTLWAEEGEPLRVALEQQAKHKSVRVALRQTKKVPALADEIKTMGRLLLIPGKSFRYELGSPAERVVIYDGKVVYVLNEKEKTGEQLSPDDRSIKPLFLTLGMGEEASFEGLKKMFKITASTEAKGRYVATLVPKSRKLQRVMKSLLMQVNLSTSFPERVGWVQRDGTEIMTEFFKPKLDQPISPGSFQVDKSRYKWK